MPWRHALSALPVAQFNCELRLACKRPWPDLHLLWGEMRRRYTPSCCNYQLVNDITSLRSLAFVIFHSHVKVDLHWSRRFGLFWTSWCNSFIRQGADSGVTLGSLLYLKISLRCMVFEVGNLPHHLRPQPSRYPWIYASTPVLWKTITLKSKPWILRHIVLCHFCWQLRQWWAQPTLEARESAALLLPASCLARFTPKMDNWTWLERRNIERKFGR